MRYLALLSALFLFIAPGASRAEEASLISESPTMAVNYTVAALGALPGHPWSEALAINNPGQIAGYAADADMALARGAVLWDGDQITDLGALTTGEWSEALTINDAGLVAGYSATFNLAGGDWTALLWDEGHTTELFSGFAGTSAYDIDDAGQIVGDWRISAVLWDGQTTALFGGQTGYHGEARAINNAGQVVGSSAREVAAVWEIRAVLWEDGQVTELDALPGDEWSTANDINGDGQVVGWSGTRTDQRHAVLWVDGQTIPLPALPGNVNSVALAINDDSQVVGYSEAADGSFHAVLWENGQVSALGALAGHASSMANDINDVGQIVGWSGPGNRDRHAVLWTPHA